MHNQLEQIGILLTEHLKNGIEDMKDSHNMIIKRKKELIKNSNILLGWISKPYDDEAKDLFIKAQKHKKSKEFFLSITENKKRVSRLVSSHLMNIRPLSSMSRQSIRAMSRSKESIKCTFILLKYLAPTSFSVTSPYFMYSQVTQDTNVNEPTPKKAKNDKINFRNLSKKVLINFGSFNHSNRVR